MDYALLYAGSSFTVGVTEEECDTTSLTKMVDAPEGTHKMAEATTHHQFLESHNMPAKPGSALIVPAKPGSVFVVPAKPESPARMVTTPAGASSWHPQVRSIVRSVLGAPRGCSVPGARRVRSRGRSVPGARRVHSRVRSVPGARSGARSVPRRGRSDPGAHRVRSRGRSVSGAHRVRSRGRSVSGAHGVRSRGCSVSGAHRVPHGLAFPSTIAPITQLSPITHLP